MKLVVALMFLLSLMFVSACKDADRSQFGSLGAKHKITLYSCGVKVGEWESTGNPSNEGHSDGYYFKDARSGKAIEISGTVIIEQE